MRSHLAMVVVAALTSAACSHTLHHSGPAHACHATQGGPGAMGIIGMSLDQRPRESESGRGELVVDRVVPDGPAANAGIRPGDRILEIEGAPTRGMSIADAAHRLRGPIDASVTLVIATGNHPRDVTITRVAPSDLWNKVGAPGAEHKSERVHASDVAPAAPGSAAPCRR